MKLLHKMSVCATSCTLVLGAIHDWYLRFGGTPDNFLARHPIPKKATAHIVVIASQSVPENMPIVLVISNYLERML